MRGGSARAMRHAPPRGRRRQACLRPRERLRCTTLLRRRAAGRDIGSPRGAGTYTQPSNHRHVRPGELNRLPVGQVQSSYALCVCRIRPSKKTMAAGRVAVGVGRPHNIKITYVQPSITLSIHARCPATFMYTSYVEPAPHETTPICTGAPPRITTSGPPESPQSRSTRRQTGCADPNTARSAGRRPR